jgi:hypothetical protein
VILEVLGKVTDTAIASLHVRRQCGTEDVYCLVFTRSYEKPVSSILTLD